MGCGGRVEAGMDRGGGMRLVGVHSHLVGVRHLYTKLVVN